MYVMCVLIWGGFNIHITNIPCIIDYYKTLQFKDLDDNEASDVFHSSIVIPFFKLFVQCCPKIASLILTQYTTLRIPTDKAWTPDMVHELTADERIVTLFTMGALTRVFANADEGQQITSIQGIGGASKTSVLRIFQRIFNYWTINVNTGKDDVFWASYFYDENICFTKGVYPYVGFCSTDRKNDMGAHIPEPIRDEVIGNSGDQTLTVSLYIMDITCMFIKNGYNMHVCL